MPAVLHACHFSTQGPQLAPNPIVLRRPELVKEGIALGCLMVANVVSGVGGHEVRPWDSLQLITILGSSHFYFFHLLLFLPPPPDTLPVLRPGYQPDYPAPWAGGQSIPGAQPARLPTSPASVSGQTWTADILFPENLGRGAGP